MQRVPDKLEGYGRADWLHRSLFNATRRYGARSAMRRTVRILIGGASICPFIAPSPAVGESGESQILRATSIPETPWPKAA